MPRTVTFSVATREAMHEEMERDASVFLMGEDIVKQGGIFGQFRGLAEAFPGRVRDFPISESVLVSSAVGAALTGGRPVVDIHFSDFLTCAMDELVNQAAKVRFMFGGQASVPLVVRAPEGAVNSAGAQHSQSLESWFVGTPGWRVVSPSNPSDAKGLLKSAIRSNDPVLFLEHKALYAQKGELPGHGAGEDLVPIGVGRVTRPGDDLTMVSWSRILGDVETAADRLAERGVSVEVIDLRSLSPWDEKVVLASVRKTGRLLVIHEAVRTCGLGAEIIATIQERALSSLKAPARRISNPDFPIPFSPALEKLVIPQVDTILGAAAEVLEIAA